MNKPLIGVVPLVDSERQSYWMLPGYMKALEEAGAIPVTLPLTDNNETLEQLASTIDGLLLTGGHDISPSLYGELPTPLCGELCKGRDNMEAILLHLALQWNIPTFGICRGIQFINAFLGGTLYQDLPTEHPSTVEHHQSASYDRPVHRVCIISDTPLSELLKTGTLEVNSYHHQAIKQIASSLRPMAIATDGIVEAVYHPKHKFLWAVQWHPEFSYLVEPSSRKLFSRFVSACKHE